MSQDKHVGMIGTFSSIFLNVAAYIDKSTVTFVLGVVVAILTITYYVLKIYNEFLSKKKNNKP